MIHDQLSKDINSRNLNITSVKEVISQSLRNKNYRPLCNSASIAKGQNGKGDDVMPRRASNIDDEPCLERGKEQSRQTTIWKYSWITNYLFTQIMVQSSCFSISVPHFDKVSHDIPIGQLVISPGIKCLVLCIIYVLPKADSIPQTGISIQRYGA